MSAPLEGLEPRRFTYAITEITREGPKEGERHEILLRGHKTMIDLANEILADHPGMDVKAVVGVQATGGKKLLSSAGDKPVLLELLQQFGPRWDEKVFAVSLVSQGRPIEVVFEANDFRGETLVADFVPLREGNYTGARLLQAISEFIPSNLRIVAAGVQKSERDSITSVLSQASYKMENGSRLYATVIEIIPHGRGGRSRSRRRRVTKKSRSRRSKSKSKRRQ